MIQFTRLASSSSCKLLLHHQPSLWRSHPRSCVVSSAWRSHYTYANAGEYHGANDHHHHRQDWDHRGFTVGIGGPVGSGKTALVLALTKRLVDKVPREFYIQNASIHCRILLAGGLSSWHFFAYRMHLAAASLLLII